MVVAIGPYHHGASDDLEKMEEVKGAAAYYFSKKGWGGKPPTEVFTVAGRTGQLYAEDAIVGLGDGDFETMMFTDACFLLQYMDAYLYFVCKDPSKKEDHSHSMDALLRTFLFSRRACINNDIMLLENQLPWRVVQAIIDSLPAAEAPDRRATAVATPQTTGKRTLQNHYKKVVAEFIAHMGNTFNICEEDKIEPFQWDRESLRSSPPPHLLGLLRLYKTEAGSKLEWPQIHRISASSAIDLAEIGIKLTPSTKEVPLFTDMNLRKRGPFGELSVAALFLDSTAACWLVNMAAFEVATASSFEDDAANTAVCSYLALLSMFMLRKEDVLELRSKGILHGHQTNAEMLTFFKSVVNHLPDTGSRFAYIMARIEEYKEKGWLRTKVHKLVYNNLRTIIKVLTIVGTLVGIFQALLSLNQGQKNDTPAQYLSFLPA